MMIPNNAIAELAMMTGSEPRLDSWAQSVTCHFAAEGALSVAQTRIC